MPSLFWLVVYIAQLLDCHSFWPVKRATKPDKVIIMNLHIQRKLKITTNKVEIIFAWTSLLPTTKYYKNISKGFKHCACEWLKGKIGHPASWLAAFSPILSVSVQNGWPKCFCPRDWRAIKRGTVNCPLYYISRQFNSASHHHEYSDYSAGKAFEVIWEKELEALVSSYVTTTTTK